MGLSSASLRAPDCEFLRVAVGDAGLEAPGVGGWLSDEPCVLVKPDKKSLRS